MRTKVTPARLARNGAPACVGAAFHGLLAQLGVFGAAALLTVVPARAAGIGAPAPAAAPIPAHALSTVPKAAIATKSTPPAVRSTPAPFTADAHGYLAFAQPAAPLPEMDVEEASGDFRPGRSPLLAPTDSFPSSLGTFGLADAHARIAAEPSPKPLHTIRFFAPPIGDARRPEPSSPFGAYRASRLADGGKVPEPGLVDLFFHLRAVGLLGAHSELALEGTQVPLAPLDSGMVSSAKEQEASLARRIGDLERTLAAKGDAPRGDARAEALVRVAVLLMERHAIAFSLEASRYDKSLASWRLIGEGDEPVFSPSAANAHLAKAVSALRRAVAEHPNAPRHAEALFLLGASLAHSEPLSAIPVLERLLPSSGERKGACHLLLAEARAATGDRKRAGAHFRAAMTDSGARVSLYAAYKLGWAHATTRIDKRKAKAHLLKALTAFKFVTKAASDPKAAPGLAGLAREALSDTVWIFGRLGDVKAARAFFEAVGARELHLVLAERVGSERAQAGKRVEALALFSRLVRLSPLSARLPTLHARVVEQKWGLGRFDAAAAFLESSPATFAPGTPWYSRNGSTREGRLARSDWLVAGANAWARRFHERAKAVRVEPAYDTAAASYSVFLANAEGEGRDVAEAHFLRGEILARRARAVDAAQAFLRAGGVEERRVSSSPLTREAYWNAVIAAGIAYKDLRRKETAAPPAARAHADAVAMTAAEAQAAARAKETQRIRKALLDSLDAWARAFPGAPETPGRLHRSALLAYVMGDAGAAREKWTRALLTKPDAAEAREGVRFFVADSAREGRFEVVMREGGAFLAVPGVDRTPLGSDLREAVEGAMFRQAVMLSRLGRREEAAALFSSFAETFPGVPNAARARFNVALERFYLGSFGDGIAALDRFSAKHPSHFLRPRVLFLAAHALESIGRTREAADIHERLASEFPARSSAPRALLRAALLREAAGDHQRAATIAGAFLTKHPLDARAHEAHAFVAAFAMRAGDRAGARAAWLRGARALATPLSSAAVPPVVLNAVAEKRLAGSLFLYGEASRAAIVDGAYAEAEATVREALAVHARLPIGLRATAPAREGIAALGAARIALLDRGLPALLDTKAVDASRFFEDADARWKSLSAVVQRYADVIVLGDPASDVAALFRAAQLQEHSARLFLEAEPPLGLPADKAAAFRVEAQRRGIPLKDNAARLYVAAWEKANSAEVATPFTGLLQETLARLRPAAFAKVAGELPAPEYVTTSLAVTEATRPLLEVPGEATPGK